MQFSVEADASARAAAEPHKKTTAARELILVTLRYPLLAY
jgi:hypothetical protein